MFKNIFPKIVPFMRKCKKKYTIQSDSPQMTIWSMRIACWMPKVTNTHAEYVILTVFPLQRWLRERASMLHYKYLSVLYCVCSGSGAHSAPLPNIYLGSFHGFRAVK